jgi:hypothetical protein
MKFLRETQASIPDRPTSVKPTKTLQGMGGRQANTSVYLSIRREPIASAGHAQRSAVWLSRGQKWRVVIRLERQSIKNRLWNIDDVYLTNYSQSGYNFDRGQF